MHDSLARIGACESFESFTETTCMELQSLIPAVTTSYVEIDPLVRRTAARVWPDPGDDWYAHYGPLVERTHVAHPHFAQLAAGVQTTTLWTFSHGDPFAASELFQHFFAPEGVGSQMLIPLPPSFTTSMAFALNRDDGGFAPREQQIAEVLRTHLGNLHRLLGRTDPTAALPGWTSFTVNDDGTIMRAGPAAVETGRRIGLDLRMGASLAGEELWERAGMRHRRHPWRVGIETITADVPVAGSIVSIRIRATAVGPHEVWISTPTSLRPEVLRQLGLTSRQQEVAQLLVSGAGTAEIADRLFISRATVRKHIEGILGTLGAHSRLDAALILLRASQ